MKKHILKYILRVVVFILLTGLLFNQFSTFLIYIIGSFAYFLYKLLPAIQMHHTKPYIVAIAAFVCTFPAYIFTSYFFAKICGLFKGLEGLKKWQIFTILFLLSLILHKTIIYCDRYHIEFNSNFLSGLDFAGLALIPSYLMYLFFNMLTKKHPVPFKTIGYLCSIEFVKDVLCKIRLKIFKDR